MVRIKNFEAGGSNKRDFLPGPLLKSHDLSMGALKTFNEDIMKVPLRVPLGEVVDNPA